MVYWWYSFGDFALGTWGYPDSIEVFREYLELSGKSEAEVAEACGIKQAMVRHMRLYGEGMDSVMLSTLQRFSRRRKNCLLVLISHFI